MQPNQLENEFPETYNSIFKLGVESEKKRVSAWMETVEVSIPKTKEGITSGKYPDPIDNELEQFNKELDQVLENNCA